MARRGFRFGNDVLSNKTYLVIGIIVLISLFWFFKSKSPFGDFQTNYLVINNTTKYGLNITNLFNLAGYKVSPNTISQPIPFNTQHSFYIFLDTAQTYQTHPGGIFFNTQTQFSWNPNEIPIKANDPVYPGSVYAKFTEFTGSTYTFKVKLGSSNNNFYPIVGEPVITQDPCLKVEQDAVTATLNNPANFNENTCAAPINTARAGAPKPVYDAKNCEAPINTAVSNYISKNPPPPKTQVIDYIIKNNSARQVTLVFTSGSSTFTIIVQQNGTITVPIINTVAWNVTNGTIRTALPVNSSYTTITIATQGGIIFN